MRRLPALIGAQDRDRTVYFEALAGRLRAAGHDVTPLDFDHGDGPMDYFIDLPPWAHEARDALAIGLRDPRHLKVAMKGRVSTSFGLIVRKAG